MGRKNKGITRAKVDALAKAVEAVRDGLRASAEVGGFAPRSPMRSYDVDRTLEKLDPASGFASVLSELYDFAHAAELERERRCNE